MKVIEKHKTDFFEALMEREVKLKTGVSWTAKKMTPELWQQIVGFMIWSQTEHKQEAQLRLFFNTTTQEWAAVPYPQEPNGMTTNEIDRPELLAELRKGLEDSDWVGFGTVHHHCTSSAFQSGTDHKDEINQPGFHVTLGSLDKAEMDFHCRFCHNGCFTETSLNVFIDYPEVLSKYSRLAAHWYLLPIAYEFPEVWKKAIIEKTVVGFNGYRNPHYHWGQDQPKAQLGSWAVEDTFDNDVQEFFDALTHDYAVTEEEIIEACHHTSEWYKNLIQEANYFFDDPEAALKRIHNEYTATAFSDEVDLDTTEFPSEPGT